MIFLPVPDLTLNALHMTASQVALLLKEPSVRMHLPLDPEGKAQCVGGQSLEQDTGVSPQSC